ncbi:tetratricopeptide repeat protein [Sphaerisporangium perillae]|uniref:tetratricopeptide repeat protein n=1 Tax=Sphaerisporangium perillae TaxID=2935860 RepID=UPI002010AB60|nr:tetratricopeptide repeat protein [Sphaerisporangium perillae]
MELAEVYSHIGELSPDLFDAEVARAIAELVSRAADIPVPLTIPGIGITEDLYALTDEVIRLGEEFERLGRTDDLILARRIVVGLLRPRRESDLLDFANALGMLAWLLTGQGRHAEALEVAEECADVLRPHISMDTRHLGFYARAVRDCGTNLAELGRLEEAVAAKREALRCYELCVPDNPRIQLDLALTCYEQSDLLLRCGEASEVLTVTDLGVSLIAMVEADCRFHHAMMLRDRASALVGLGQASEAVDAGYEAASILRDIADQQPACSLQLALVLQLISDPLSSLDRDEEALNVAAEAVQIADSLGSDAQMVRALVTWVYGRRLLEHGRLLEAKDAYLAAVPNSEEIWPGLAPELAHLTGVLADEGLLSDAAAVAVTAARVYKVLTRADHSCAVPYADLLGRLAELDFQCGRHELALRSAERAVEVAKKSEDRETLARALGHLGSSLAGTGRDEQAEHAARAALEMWEELFDQDPDTFRPPLAGAWNNLANKLGTLGRAEEAAAASQESVTLYKHTDQPHELANALNSLAVRLHVFGQEESARDNAERAVAIYDRLIADEPKHLRNLAVVLHNLSGYHAALGHLDLAWTTADRAAGIRYGLHAKDPDAIESDLLLSLRAAAEYASATGRFEDAARAAAIRVEVFEAHDEPGVELAEALVDLCGSLTGTKRIVEAAEAAERAESLAATFPEVPGLHAFCLDRLAWCRAQLGQPAEAVRLARRGIALLEPIADDDLDPHLHELGVLLHDLAGYLLACGRPIEALGAAGRAVSIRERLTAVSPQRFRSLLSEALQQQSQILLALGRTRPAEEARLRALELATDAAPGAAPERRCTAGDLEREYNLLADSVEFRPEIAKGLHELAEATRDVRFVHAGDVLDWLALSLSALADALCRLGRPEEEVASLRLIVAVREEEGNIGDVALTLRRLGPARMRAGQFEWAWLESIGAAAMLRDLVESGRPEFLVFQAQAWEDAGNAMKRLGYLEEAVAYVRKALGLYELAVKDDPDLRQHEARAVQSLADLVTRIGRTADAIEPYEEA